jgi:hypothetical protein
MGYPQPLHDMLAAIPLSLKHEDAAHLPRVGSRTTIGRDPQAQTEDVIARLEGPR